MSLFILEVVQSVFKPAVVALSLATGVAIMAYEGNSHTPNRDTININVLGCSGILSPICGAFG